MAPTESLRRQEADIRKLSGAMAKLLGAAVVLYPLALAAYAFGGGRLVLSHPWVANLGLHVSDLSLGVSGALFVALILAAAPLVWGLWRLQKMFAEFAAGRVFAVAAVSEFERFAWALALAAVVEPLAGALLGLLLPSFGVSMKQSLPISVSSTHLFALLLSLVLAVIAKVMRMAARLATENAEYV